MASAATAGRLPGAAPPRRLLVRGVNWLGDAVMTTPALLRLREALPGCHIALLTPEKLAGLWDQHPALDAVVAFSPGEGLRALARRLRALQFDTALVLPNSPRSALEAWLAGIPRRIGYARPWRNWLLTEALPTRPEHLKMHKRSEREIERLLERPPGPSRASPAPAAHQVHEYLGLAAALGANPAPVPPALAVAASELEAAALRFGLAPPALSGAPLFGLNPGAEYGPAKRWPTERFISAAREIQQRTGCTWVLFGGPSDAASAATLATALAPRQAGSPKAKVYNLAGQTSLRELLALLKLCRVLLTNDTGPMHVAAALGTPVVVPFGSTSPALTGPGLPGDSRHRLLQSDAPCAPCFRRTCPIDFRCMHSISERQVVAAVLQASGLEAGG